MRDQVGNLEQMTKSPVCGVGAMLASPASEWSIPRFARDYAPKAFLRIPVHVFRITPSKAHLPESPRAFKMSRRIYVWGGLLAGKSPGQLSLKRVAQLGFLVFLLVVAAPCYGEFKLPGVEQVVAQVKEVYSRKCCFKAVFNQLTVNVAMDLKDRFKGDIYVKKPGLIALDVKSPEKQKVVISGRAYTVFFPEDGSAVRGEVPPDINVEHFFGFFADIGSLDRKFLVSFPIKSHSEHEKLIFLELTDRKNLRSTYRIVLGIDWKLYTIRRAIIYDALGNYNRFDLSEIAFVDSIPDSRFRIDYGPRKGVRPFTLPFLKESERK